MNTKLVIGIWGGHEPWTSRLCWLLGREFGYPIEQVVDSFESYPLLVVPDSIISTNHDTLTKYIKSGGSLLVSHSSKYSETIETSRILPVQFTRVKSIHGDVVVNVSHPLAMFFQYYSLSLGKRTLSMQIRELKKCHPTSIPLELIDRDVRHPLLVCDKFEGSKYAVITLGDEDIEKSRCGPLLYLAALHFLFSDIPFVKKSFWKRDKRATLVLTFDFEGLAKYSNIKRYWWWSRYFDRALLRLGSRPILTFLKKSGTCSTWFMLASQVIKTSQLAKDIAKGKFVEIGGHGDLHQGIDGPTGRFDKEDKERQSQRLIRMKEAIRNTLSVDVKGFRAPGLYANHDTIRALQENGFEWDSSASPQSDMFFKESPWPFQPILEGYEHATDTLVEIPIQAPWDRWCPLHGCFHSPEEYKTEIQQGFQDILYLGGIQVLLIHPYELVKYPGYWGAAKSHVEQSLTQKENIEIATCGQVAHDWKQRDEMILQASLNDKIVNVRIDKGYPGLTLFIHIPEAQRIKEISDGTGTLINYTQWNDLHAAVFSINNKSETFTIRFDGV